MQSTNCSRIFIKANIFGNEAVKIRLNENDWLKETDSFGEI